ncbi:MAG: HAD family phosphatase [Candidatus Fimivivens sp.]|nr:HAD family phosphatase [Candidatus Fimivivens sp.]
MLIKNIVFDMGMVLIDFAPMNVCRRFTDNEQDAVAVANALFDSDEWVLVDKGAITEDALLLAAQERLKTPAQKEAAAQCLLHWHEYALTPKKGMEQVVKMVKDKGYGVYLLSNTSMRIHAFKHIIPGISLFDGTIFSAEEKCGKPDREIYERLFNKYSLKPEECFFIDDVEANIDGAKSCGMAGYCFVDGDVERLRQALEQIFSA